MLKSGKNNKKLGGRITKGSWKGMPLYSLTLEERNTCPDYCEQWDNCYGNNMPFAIRYDHTHPDFLPLLRKQLETLSMKHEAGFVVRLHVLGDFFDKEYIAWWRNMLQLIPNLHIYGYTHHRCFTAMGYAIVNMNRKYKERCRVRFSDDTATLFSTSCVEGRPDNWHFGRTKLACPEQTGHVPSCAACTICWESQDKSVVFFAH